MSALPRVASHLVGHADIAYAGPLSGAARPAARWASGPNAQLTSARLQSRSRFRDSWAVLRPLSRIRSVSLGASPQTLVAAKPPAY